MRIVRAVGTAVVVLWLGGCAAKNYRTPIAGFRAASDQVIVAAKDYYQLANKIERDHLVDDRLATRDPIEPKALRSVSSTLSPADLAVRLQALRVLADYGSLLVQLANSTAQQDVTAGAQALGASISSLTDSAAKLCQQCSKENETLQMTSGAAAKAIGPILNLLVGRRIQQGLENHIKSASEPVSNLIAALRRDMSGLYERRRQAVDLALSDAIRSYNEEAKKGPAATPDRLEALAGRVKLAADVVEKLPNASPDAALDAMDRAHRELVAFASAKRTPQSFAQLADTIQGFAVQAQQAAQSVHSLKGP